MSHQIKAYQSIKSVAQHAAMMMLYVLLIFVIAKMESAVKLWGLGLVLELL
jgi:hypothetical protein